MHAKYSLYKSFCIISNILLMIFLLGIIYYLSFDTNVLHNSHSIPAFLLILSFPGIYLANNYWGLKLIERYQAEAGISKRGIIKIVIFFFLQLILQVIVAVSFPEEIRTMEDIIKINLITHMWDYRLFVLNLPSLLIFLLTIYIEIFTFPLIKAVESKHKKLLKKIDDIGNA